MTPSGVNITKWPLVRQLAGTQSGHRRLGSVTLARSAPGSEFLQGPTVWSMAADLKTLPAR